MDKHIVTIYVLVAVLGTVACTDYCNVRTCQLFYKGPHTFCTYRSDTPSSRCPKVKKVGLSDAERSQIVNKHNELRQYVANGLERRGNPGPQPRASNMQNLEWDSELASIAQRWVNQCKFGHDPCRDVHKYQVGQNVAEQSVTDTFKVEDVVTAWYEEVKIFNRNYVAKYVFERSTGHYSQVVWAETNKIGCGAITYAGGYFDNIYIACNYGPAGNFRDATVYK